MKIQIIPGLGIIVFYQLSGRNRMGFLRWWLCLAVVSGRWLVVRIKDNLIPQDNHPVPEAGPPLLSRRGVLVFLGWGLAFVLDWG